MKLQERNHKEVKSKKEKAMDIWSQLEEETKNQVENGDTVTGKASSPEDDKKRLAAELDGSSASGGTALAQQILGTNANGDPNESEKEQKTAAQAKAQTESPLPPNIMQHPILQYAKERRAKCQEVDKPTEFSKERCKKAMHAAVHFSNLRTAAIRRNKSAKDTLEKWDTRVGHELKRYDMLESRLPKEEQEPEKKVPKESEPEKKAPEPEEDPLPEMPPSGMPQGGDDLVLLEESTTAENCEKDKVKLAAQISEQSSEQAAMQAKLGKMHKTVKSLMASTVSLGEAADVAADAAIKSARLEAHAHSLAHEASTPIRRTQEAIEKASMAKAQAVTAYVAATQAATAE